MSQVVNERIVVNVFHLSNFSEPLIRQLRNYVITHFIESLPEKRTVVDMVDCGTVFEDDVEVCASELSVYTMDQFVPPVYGIIYDTESLAAASAILSEHTLFYDGDVYDTFAIRMGERDFNCILLQVDMGLLANDMAEIRRDSMFLMPLESA